MQFLGNIEAKVDAKGRVFIPASFRKILAEGGEERLVLRKDVYQDCLVLYPESVWMETQDQLRSRLNRWNRMEQNIFRQFVSDAELLMRRSASRPHVNKRRVAVAARRWPLARPPANGRRGTGGPINHGK